MSLARARQPRPHQLDDDDIISRCGSISGETFASRRSVRPGCSLRQHNVDILAKQLRDYQFEDQDLNCKLSQNAGKKRINNIFHHFRYLVVIFGGFSVGTMFLLRYNITISILKMVNQTHLYLEEHPDKTVDDMIAAGYTPGGEFNWNNEIQHMIMSWYMVAYTLPQIPATKLATIIGSRLAIPISLAICAISAILTPYSCYLGWQYVLILRLINGLGGSSVLPMLLTLVENWMRYDEISLGLSMAQGFTSILAATNPLIAGYLSSIHWSYSFYIPGVCTLIFCALWLILVTDNPIDNRFISEKELRYICECEPVKPQDDKKAIDLKNTGQEVTTKQEDELEFKPDSWTQILRVPSFYAYMIIWCFYCSSYSGFAFVLPTYLRQFLKISIAQNGFYCFLVQSGAIAAVLWPHPILRLFEHTFGWSISISRKVTYLIVCLLCATTWIYVGAFHEAQLILLFINRCFHCGNDIVVTGCLMSNYAKAGISSFVFSIVNTVGNLSVVFTSTFIGWLLDYTAQSREGWCMIFSGLGTAQLIMWLIFAIVVPSGPIKFKNKRRMDFEAKTGRSVSSQLEQSPVSVPIQPSKAKENTILNNFEKLKGPAASDDSTTNPKGKESREI